MKIIILTLLMIGLVSCKKIEALPPITTQVNILSESFQLSDLHKSRVSELFIVLFKNDLKQEQWAAIFKDTQQLSSNKRRLMTIEGLSDEESEKIRSQMITENADLLQRLSAQSIYLLNWSFGDENCRFLFKENLNLICKPRVLDNPLNGGLPQQQGVISIIHPDPVTDEIKLPYMNLVLFKESPRLKMNLRFKLESQSATEFWFKGDVKPLEYSFESLPYEYGYAEMTLTK